MAYNKNPYEKQGRTHTPGYYSQTMYHCVNVFVL